MPLPVKEISAGSNPATSVTNKYENGTDSMMLQGIFLALAVFFAIFFREQREQAMIKSQYERSNRMYLFWTTYSFVHLLRMTSSLSGSVFIYQTVSIISTTLMLIYLYMVLSELFGY